MQEVLENNIKVLQENITELSLSIEGLQEELSHNLEALKSEEDELACYLMKEARWKEFTL